MSKFESPGSLFGAPDEFLAPDDEVDKILLGRFSERTSDTFSAMYQDYDHAYTTQRRKLLGPESDITHDDYKCRPNHPHENFLVKYEMKPVQTNAQTTDSDGSRAHEIVDGIEVTELIIDHLGNLVNLDQL